MTTKSLPEAPFSIDEPAPGVVRHATGHLALIRALSQWGVNHYAGVNGGGVIHVTKHLEPLQTLDDCRDGVPRLLTLSEYIAGFVPLGYHIASGGMAAAVATTGAAAKLLAAGLSDAKLHNIPAVYLFALNAASARGLAPLQDVSEDGMNIVDQLAAELGDGCIVLDDLDLLAKQLCAAQEVLAQSRPVALCFRPDSLSGIAETEGPWIPHGDHGVNELALDHLIESIRARSVGQRVVLYVGEEAGRCPNMPALTTILAERLQAPTVWSVNGANGVSAYNRFGLGHIQFGGNDRALELWRSLGPDDIVIMIGFDPGEYCLNLEPIRAGLVWHLTALPDSYGSRHGSFRHRVLGAYHQVQGDLVQVLQAVVARLDPPGSGPHPAEPLPELNAPSRRPEVTRGRVDLVQFYERLGRHWRPGSIGFDDVCVAYRDRPYVMQRPHRNIRFYTAYQGSAMGGAFGLGVGAKLADPSLHTFVFSGDGCWRLFGSSLAEVARLGLRLFIFNNGTYGLVDSGLGITMPALPRKYRHADLARVDFVAAARAHGWDACTLDADLRNVGDVMAACYASRGRSLLVEVPVDPNQVLGPNPRASRL